MGSDTFKAMVLRQEGEGTTHNIEWLTDADLPEGDVLVDVQYSSMNFKDALAVTGTGKIVRTWPMVPGIDLAGTVRDSSSDEFSVGAQVVLTGWGVGERYWGGYSQRQRVQSKWLVELPDGLDPRQAMGIGTAGLTAMLCVMRLEDAGLKPSDGSVLVSGAMGGVGSVAVSILASLGYDVTALILPSQAEHSGYLSSLGAKDIISGDEWGQPPRPLETQVWAGAIDTVGGKVLARILSSMDYGGLVANCGLAGSHDLPSTVMPFILRGVSLLGVDSVMCPRDRRIAAWQRIVMDLPTDALSAIHHVASLEETPSVAQDMLAGKLRGRVVVDLNN
ncbi:acrylyl-CoA reductase (NADPH) [Natronocella acetinitrilica]|uniref:Acrylyl-CoA reductase (NADPH) n=1 Tax=Natronocella acetinitrilica TaxID=414046 RepID=A0AAE3KDS9_9GAMM|nr:MDR family oxidoreductase [Natronocella acetinitrilica]MCP1677179.1 acrylyl-CoA reductase (NADPH) [Natronocella acetinitrilica]